MLHRNGRSDTDLLHEIRKAATSELSSHGGNKHRRNRAGSSVTDGHSHISGRRSMLSTDSYASGYSRSQGMSLKDMQKHVQNAAMDRYISSLEKQAKEAADYGGSWQRKLR